MGLSSALTTALTGLNAAETQIDVSGNNLANSQTIGFKASDVVFATQFLRTLSEGSAPTDNNGGTNPRQFGLGVRVAGVTPDFSQGTIEVSSSSSDLAIQGDGFFIVEGSQGDQLYTRNGVFTTNFRNELVSTTGYRLLGYGVDEFYELQTNETTPLTIPFGSAAAAQATQNVYLNGNLTPTGDIADTAEVIASDVLGDAAIDQPDISTLTIDVAPRPDATGSTASEVAGTNPTFFAGDQYEYVFTFTDAAGNETLASQTAVPVSITSDGNDVALANVPSIPTDGSGIPQYDTVNIYRHQLGVPAGDPNADYHLVGSVPGATASFTDSGNAPGASLDDTSLNGIYTYLVTFSGSGLQESRPSALMGPLALVNGRVRLADLPSIPTGSGYDTINVYRNLASDAGSYYQVTSGLHPGDTYTDAKSDSAIADPTKLLDMDGPKITTATLLTDVIKRNGMSYDHLFQEGELAYTGRKGGNLLQEKTFTIEADTTVGEYIQFLTAASGIQQGATIPDSEDRIPGESGTLSPGATVTADGRIRLTSNNGTANAVSISSSAFQLTTASGTALSPSVGFSTLQDAVGQSAVSDFVVYDSLGVPLDVRLTTALESRDGTTTTYRWFADSGDNDPAGPDHDIAVGTGLISFDGEGNLIHANDPTVSIDRQDLPSTQPLIFNLDFSNVSGFATDTSEIAASRQDGSAVGTLTSYSVGESGLLTGVFSNGISRTLGQIRLAQFSNPEGLEQRGDNMYGVGFNSGLPVEGDPGNLGLGNIVAGALELSNSDIGQNLVDLMLASTQYRANSRVISTSQQLLDELMNIRR